MLCLQETKCPDELFPLRRLRSARLSAHRHPRPEGLSRRGDDRAPADRDRRKAPLLRDSRQPPSVGALRRRAASRMLLHNFYVPAGGDEPDPEINPKFRHKLDFVAEMNAVRAEHDEVSGLDPGRRPQHRAARARRLVAQAASQGGQPHAGRDRKFRGDAQGRRLGRPDAAQRAARAEALHLVELSRAGLGSVGPRPPARPCLVVGKSGASVCRLRDPARRRAAGSGRRTMCR